jgi:hypothetical protein
MKSYYPRRGEAVALAALRGGCQFQVESRALEESHLLVVNPVQIPCVGKSDGEAAENYRVLGIGMLG